MGYEPQKSGSPAFSGQLVGLGDDGVLLGELAVEIADGVLLGAVEEPEANAQGEHVLALDDGLVVEPCLLERLAGHGGDVGDHDIVFIEVELRQRVEGLESGLAEVLLGDRVTVEDDRGPGLEPFAVGLERCGVHRHQHVAVVAGVEFPVVAEVYLKARDARNGSLRGAYFGRVVRKGRDAVSQQGRGVGKERARELHAVAGVARETDDDVLQLLHFGLFHDDRIRCLR